MENVSGFERDEYNADKIWQKHKVSISECEEVFFHSPLITSDPKHSQTEARYFAQGITSAGRRLFLVYTVRNANIRVISARDMSRKERREFRLHEEDT